jgi:hypothetical protein
MDRLKSLFAATWTALLVNGTVEPEPCERNYICGPESPKPADTVEDGRPMGAPLTAAQSALGGPTGPTFQPTVGITMARQFVEHPAPVFIPPQRGSLLILGDGPKSV